MWCGRLGIATPQYHVNFLKCTFFFRLDSDFPIPYAWVDRTLPLPAPQGSTLLQRFIASHGKKAVTQGPNLAENKVHNSITE